MDDIMYIALRNSTLRNYNIPYIETAVNKCGDKLQGEWDEGIDHLIIKFSPEGL